MSTTALAAVLAKFAGLNVAGKAVAGLAVAAGAIGGVGGASAVADHVTGTPEHVQAGVAQHVDGSAAAHAAKPTGAPTHDATGAPTHDATAEAAGDSHVDGAGDRDGVEGSDDVELGAGATGAGPADLPDAAELGQHVAADARVGGVDGHKVSAEARAKVDVRGPVDGLPEVPEADAAAHAGGAVTGTVTGGLNGHK
jgi:hypothetical protein